MLRVVAVVFVVAAVTGGAGALWLSGAFARMGAASVENAVRLSMTAGFQVQEVLITGRRHIPAKDLRDAVGVARGVPMLTLDIAGVHQRLSHMPWVAAARVARRLPDTLLVEITERRPLALWQAAGQLRLIATDGTVLADKNLEPWAMLPVVVGHGAPAQAAALFALLAAEPEVAQQVSSAVYTGAGGWDLHMKSGVVARLPAEDAALALARLARVDREKGLLAKNIRTVDVRQPDRLVILPAAQAKAQAGG